MTFYRLAKRSAALLLVTSTFAESQGTQLRGRVVSPQGTPIAAATVTLSGIGYSVRTDSAGYFLLSGQPGSTLALTFSAPGYRNETASITLGRGKETVAKDVVLTSDDAPEPEVNPSDRVLRGRIQDPDRAPIAYANVQLNGGRVFVTDDSGRFSIPFNVSGGFRLIVRRIGFEPTEVKLDAMPDTAVRIQLMPLATALPEQRITGRSPFVRLDLGGFYSRMADREKGINRGYFITPEELERRNPFIVTSAVEELPNIRIRPSRYPIDAPKGPAGLPKASNNPMNRYLRIEDGSGCPLTIYLDRIKISPVVARSRGGSALMDEQINTLITPTTLSGIEVYTRKATVPPEFSMVEGTCGVVLFWTR